MEQPAFNKRETDLVASLSAPIGEALRLSARPPDDVLVRDVPPGLLTFDLAGELISANEPARSWLAELPPDAVSPPISVSTFPSGSSSRCSMPPA